MGTGAKQPMLERLEKLDGPGRAQELPAAGPALLGQKECVGLQPGLCPASRDMGQANGLGWVHGKVRLCCWTSAELFIGEHYQHGSVRPKVMPGVKGSVQTKDATSALPRRQLPNAGGEVPASSLPAKGFHSRTPPHFQLSPAVCIQSLLPAEHPMKPSDLQLIPGDSLLPGCMSIKPSGAGGTVLAWWVGERRRVKLAEQRLIRLESCLIAGCLWSLMPALTKWRKMTNIYPALAAALYLPTLSSGFSSPAFRREECNQILYKGKSWFGQLSAFAFTAFLGGEAGGGGVRHWGSPWAPRCCWTGFLGSPLPRVPTAWEEEVPGPGSTAEQAPLMGHKKRGRTCSPA